MIKFLTVFGRYAASELSQLEAAELLGVGKRTFRRRRQRFEDDGDGRGQRVPSRSLHCRPQRPFRRQGRTGSLDDAGLEHIGWVLVETDANFHPTDRPIGGLHESVLETDPTGREMRPRPGSIPNQTG